MTSFQAAASFPFASAALSKAWPSLGMETLLELQRKNAVALTNANQVAFDGLSALAQRQGDLMKATVDELGRVVGDALTAVPFDEKMRKQADASRQIYDTSAAGFRELYDIATRVNVTAAGILSTRITEALGEWAALFAASPAERAGATGAASSAAIAGPAADVEGRAPDGNTDDPVEPEPAVEAAPDPMITEPVAEIEEPAREEDADAPDEPKPARKAAPRSPRTTGSTGGKASRRPPSRR